MTDDQLNQIMQEFRKLDQRLEHFDGKLDHIVENMATRDDQEAGEQRIARLEKRITALEQMFQRHEEHAA